MSKDDANIKLMRLIAELDDGEYEVNTSKGKFKVEKSSYRNYIMDDHEIHKNILITDEKGKKFSSYYFCHRWDYKWYDTTTEREIDYSNKFNLPYRYFIDCEVGKITIYQNEDHTKCYRIDNDYITNGEYETVAWIKDNTISDHLMEIDLNNFDRTIEINNKKVKISKDKDIQ